MIKAIIFDCFGVLIQDATKHFSAELLAHDPEKAKQFKALAHTMDKGIMSEEEGGALQAALLGMTPEAFRDSKNKGEVRNDELIEYILSLKDDYTVAMLSNINSRARLDVRFKPNQLDEVFDLVVASGDEGFIKPEPEIYEITAAKLGVAPEECIMIDDIEVFCQGARDVGMQAFQFTSNTQTINTLNQLIDRGEKRG